MTIWARAASKRVSMELSLLPLLVFLLGLSVPISILAYAAVDTARWQREEERRCDSE